ncbi:MAG: PqqD family protein [Acidimicrobiia bacterium]
MSDDTRYVRAPHVLQRRTLDTFVLLAVEGDEPVVLGGTGADVWTLIADARSLDDLVDVLAEAYQGDRAVIAADVQELLDSLVVSGVALRVPG